MNIYDLALELLELYEEAEKGSIGEYHGDPVRGMKELKKDVEDYRKQIEQLRKEDTRETTT